MKNKSGSQVQPGYCIVQQPRTLASQAQMIFQGRKRPFINAINYQASHSAIDKQIFDEFLYGVSHD